MTAVLILLIAASRAFALNPGELGGQSLKLATDARPVGLGEAFCAVADDASAIYWNPAGLVQLKDKEMSLSYMNRLIDILSFNFSYAQEINDRSAIGLGLLGLYASDTRRDETTGNDLGKFMDSNTYLAIEYARKCNNGHGIACPYAWGLGLKFLYNQLDAYKSSNITLDVSSLYKFSQNIKLGLNLQNIPLGTSFSGDLETVPLNLKTGIAYAPSEKNFTLAADLNVPNDGEPSLHLGAERWFGGIFAARTGYQYKTQEVHLGNLYGFAVGWGLRFRKYMLDYAFTPYGDLGNDAHRVTLGAVF